jgi:hypothetical protein
MSQFPQITSNLSTANFRASVLTQLAQGIPVTIAGSSGATDYELVVSTYTCRALFTGASVGDIITQTQVIAITNGVASTFLTVWRNQTSATDLASAPASANISLNGATALTDAQLRASAVPVSLAAGTNNIGAVTSNNSLIERVASFIRPADTTTYASGDLVANNTTAGSVVPLTFTTVTRSAGDSVRIERARINTSNALLTNASFRLHLFETTPVPTVGDNGVFNTAGVLATSGIDGYLGNFSITLSNSGTTGSSGRGVPDVGSAIIATPATGTSIFGLLEVTAAYVPVSAATFTVSLEAFRP